MSIFSKGLLDKVGPKDQLIGWGIIGLPIAILFALGLLFLRPIPISTNMITGCYEAAGAPALNVQGTMIQIMEPERRILGFVAEPAKQGYRLTVSPALSLRQSGVGKYAFVADERGDGYFWPLLPNNSDDLGSMREPKDYGGRFQVIARDGVPIIYRKSNRGNACS